MSDAAKKAQRGGQLDAVTKLKAPTTEADIQGHQYVWASLAYHDHVSPFGSRRYVKQEPGAPLGRPCHQTTELAAPRSREFRAPAGVQVIVWFDAYDLCRPVVQACHAQGCHLASPLPGNRCLSKPGWQLNAGR